MTAQPPGAATLPAAQSPHDPAAADSRLMLARSWLEQLAPQLAPEGWQLDLATIRPASSDASFRRYFRLDALNRGQPQSLILMDAPPPHEDVRPFLHVTDIFQRAGLHVPQVHAQEPEQGFLLLSDLGTKTYLQQLHPHSAPALYGDACQALITLHQHGTHEDLPPYNHERLLAEMRLFDEWYLSRHVGVSLNPQETTQLHTIYGLISQQCQSQAQVIVHRDYHSRNLMCTPQRNPGVLDYQDAVIGPITYDLVSLLRDAYIVWPEEVQIDWAILYWERARKAGLPVPTDFGDFWRDFEWMGLQRHLKVLGIFARLYHRDGKDGYLKDLPAVMAYTQAVARRYVPLAPLARLLDKLPAA